MNDILAPVFAVFLSDNIDTHPSKLDKCLEALDENVASDFMLKVN